MLLPYHSLIVGYYHSLHAAYHRSCIMHIEEQLTNNNLKIISFYDKIKLRNIVADELYILTRRLQPCVISIHRQN